MGVKELVEAIAGWDGQRGGKAIRLSSAIADAVADGRIPLGARLPPERSLAGAIGVARSTLVDALTNLRQAGWVVTRAGSGSRVALPADHHIRTAPISTRRGAAHRDLASAMPAAPLHDVLDGMEAIGDQLRDEFVDTGHRPGGLSPLRQRIADLLSADGLPTRASQVLVTTGAMDALGVALLLTRGSNRRRRVLVESPTYPGALAAIALEGAQPVGWSTAPDAASLAPLLADQRPDAMFVVVDGHNPTGAIRSTGWRETVARQARRHDVRIIVDHTLRPLDLRDEPQGEPPLAAWAPDALMVGSFSKVIWAGLRVGWLRASRAEVAYLVGRDLRSASVIDQLLVHHLLEHHDRYVRQRREHLVATRDQILRHLPTDELSLEVPPEGGIAAWLRLTRLSASTLAQRAAKEGVLLAPGPLFHVDGRGDRYFRLPLTLAPETIPETVSLLDRLAVGAPRE